MSTHRTHSAHPHISPHSNPAHLLTPAMRGVIERMHRAARPPMHSMTPQQARDFYEAGSGILDLPPHRMARVEALRIPTRDGALASSTEAPTSPTSPTGLHAELVVPHGNPPSAQGWPVLLYYHGGGFTIGSVATHASLCRHLAHLAHVAVVSVDYRLAPEHKFPTAVHDAWDSLQWLHQHAAALGLDAGRMAVGGDSAGGTLSIVTALQARDAGLRLALQLLFYPGCAAHQDTASHRRFAQGFVLEEPSITWFFNQYLNHPGERDDWRFSPLNAPDLDGVAPAWIVLAECDPLVDEGIQFADRLRMSGVPVDLEIYRGVTHEFIKMGRAIPEALKAHNDAARALRQAFA